MWGVFRVEGGGRREGAGTGLARTGMGLCQQPGRAGARRHMWAPQALSDSRGSTVRPAAIGRCGRGRERPSCGKKPRGVACGRGQGRALLGAAFNVASNRQKGRGGGARCFSHEPHLFHHPVTRVLPTSERDTLGAGKQPVRPAPCPPGRHTDHGQTDGQTDPRTAWLQAGWAAPLRP